MRRCARARPPAPRAKEWAAAARRRPRHRVWRGRRAGSCREIDAGKQRCHAPPKNGLRDIARHAQSSLPAFECPSQRYRPPPRCTLGRRNPSPSARSCSAPNRSRHNRECAAGATSAARQENTAAICRPLPRRRTRARQHGHRAPAAGDPPRSALAGIREAFRPQCEMAIWKIASRTRSTSASPASMAKACSSTSTSPASARPAAPPGMVGSIMASHVLLAMGVAPEVAQATARFSIGKKNDRRRNRKRAHPPSRDSHASLSPSTLQS